MAISVPLPIAKGGTGAAATGDTAFATTNATASGESSVAIGAGATASAAYTVAIGKNATVSALESTAVGPFNQATAQASTAVGFANSAYATLSTAVGEQTTANGVGSSCFGFEGIASGDYSTSVGSENIASGDNSSAIGYNNDAVSNFSNAFGYSSYAYGSASSAFGYYVHAASPQVAEFGYWTSPTTRAGAIRTDSTGMAALTTATGSTALADGGATAGYETAGTLPRGAAAFRASGDDVFLDYNNAGSIKTGALTPCRGQCSKMTDGTITGLSTSTYKTTGLTATLDTTTNVGTSLGTTDTFAIKNTSGKTRVLKVYASMDCTAGSNQEIGIKLAKNTTPIDATECRNNTGAHNFAKLVTNWMVSLDNNDEICLYVANFTSTTNIVMKRARITASSVD